MLYSGRNTEYMNEAGETSDVDPERALARMRTSRLTENNLQ